MQTIICKIEPMGKPRMTRADKWKKRDCVLRYRAFADQLRLLMRYVDLSNVNNLSWIAYFPMPETWSKKKKESMNGMPHRQKPDRDNVDKAILDALFDNDAPIWQGTLTKLWDDGKGSRIEITVS